MRAALVVALAAGLLLVATGCGSSNAATSSISSDAASLVPPSALAYVSADSSLNSDAWSAIKKLTGPLKFDTAAVGDQLNLAVVGIDNGKPETIAIVKPKDEAKLRTLAAKYDQGNEHYTVQHVGDWSVVADSAEAFQAVRNANAGTSLADTEEFKQALTQLDGNAVAFAYANGVLAKQLPANVRPLVGSPKWFTAQLTGDKNELKLDVHATGWSPVAYKPTLLRDVPSGAILAVSFKDAAQLPFAFLKQYLRGVTGEGVLYIVPGAILPVMTLEVQPRNPAAAASTFRKIAKQVGKNVPLNVERRGNKVLLTTAQPGLGTGGKSILDDKPFKDALAAADAPDEVTWLAYADIQRLAPLAEAFAPLLLNKNGRQTKIEIPKSLDTLVAYGSSGGLAARVTLR
jgi:hypothetical protein